MSESKKDPKQAAEAANFRPDEERSSGSFAGVLGVFLALIAMGMASYPIYRMMQPESPSTTDQSVQQLAQQLAALQAGQQQQIERYEQRVQDLSTLVNEVQSGAARVEENAAGLLVQLREEMLAMAGTTSQDWLMAEVEYLLRLANQRVLMEKDPEGAIALLQAADEIVRDARGITGFELREALAFDLGQLESVERLDIDGLYLQLSVLARQVDQLTQKQQHFEAGKPEPVMPVITTLSWAERLWGVVEDAGRRLATLVDYRRGAAVIIPILPPTEEYYLRQNLVLKFQLAELALLRGEQPIYGNALAEAGQWLPQYFDLQNPQAKAMQAAIEKLRSIDISRQMPDISGSLRVAREMMAKFSQQSSRRQTAIELRQTESLQSDSSRTGPSEVTQ